MIKVYNPITQTVYGTLDTDGNVVKETITESITLSKIPIHKTNHDKRYDIGCNELKRIERTGEPLKKGCMFLNNYGETILAFLMFEKEDTI